jgi:alpha/beta superfamily hydrolase
MNERLSLDMSAAVKAISLTEVLTIHGSADTTIPVEDAHSFAQDIKTHSLTVIDGADHSFRNHVDVLTKRITGYLTKGL